MVSLERESALTQGLDINLCLYVLCVGWILNLFVQPHGQKRSQ